jgi:hypothetical protein
MKEAARRELSAAWLGYYIALKMAAVNSSEISINI